MLGTCAFALLVTPIAAHAVPAPAKELETDLRRHVTALRHSRSVLRFFDGHRWLLQDPRFRREAKRQLARHRARLVRTMRRLSVARAALRGRRQARLLASARAQEPQWVICRVFGSRCEQALQVARCESGLSTTAQNGQYLGLFQMGSSERRLFGHGASAAEQAKAAHRYFLSAGGDWSPWSCKPW